MAAWRIRAGVLMSESGASRPTTLRCNVGLRSELTFGRASATSVGHNAFAAFSQPSLSPAVIKKDEHVPLTSRTASGAKADRGSARRPEEVATITGRTADGRIETVTVVPDGSPVANCAFDVTPARLVTGLITERGLIAARRESLAASLPERARQ